MNEKTKRILRYVACGLGGLALGIGLLGGLAMCASSGKSTKAESVNTILATRKNQIITTEGGYTGYRITIPNEQDTLENNTYYYHAYDVDTSTYNLTEVEGSGSLQSISVGFSSIREAVENVLSNYSPSGTNVRFFTLEGKSDVDNDGSFVYWSYFTFYNRNGIYLTIKPFLLTNLSLPIWKLSAYNNAAQTGFPIILNCEKSDLLLHSRNPRLPDFTYIFQDCLSYYKQIGYEDGYSEGNSTGYSSGYAEGYETGESVGYSSGYAEGFRTGYMNTYYAFTSLTANLNKVWNMAEIPWHRNTDILVTQDNFDDFPFFDIAHLQVGIYINWAYLALFRDTVTLTPYYVYAQRYTTSQNDGYNVCINIAPASQDTIQEDGNIGGTTGPYLLQEDSLFQLSHTTVWTAPNRCRLIGFMEDTEDIYTNWFDDGYLIPQGIEVDGNAYEEGYRQGQHDATNDTDIQNVFSLLTPAFTAVGGFFNLKVFGFLPLYWFFLAPLFVALITLILRMVKH